MTLSLTLGNDALNFELRLLTRLNDMITALPCSGQHWHSLDVHLSQWYFHLDMQDFYSRGDKANDTETILYEIAVLVFAKERLAAPKPDWTPADTSIYIEAFLLHYRNLLEFFGHPKPRETDLTILRPEYFWPNLRPSAPDLATMTKTASWGEHADSISKYLNHCTTHRTGKKNWPIAGMYEELRPAITKFVSLLTEYKDFHLPI